MLADCQPELGVLELRAMAPRSKGVQETARCLAELWEGRWPT